MAELRLKDDTNENTAQDTLSNSKTEAAKLKDRTSCGSDEKPSESDNVTCETKASERGLGSSDSSGEEIPKEICDAAREEGSATSGSVRDSDVFYHIYENELHHAGHHASDPEGPLRAILHLHLQILHPQLAQPLLHGSCW